MDHIDVDWYLTQYPDVKMSGLHALEHFQKIGIHLGRRIKLQDTATVNDAIYEEIQSAGFFDQQYYISQYSDVRDSETDPLSHYILYGSKEGRWANQSFDTGYYLRMNLDVATSTMNPLVHYLRHGREEGRRTYLQKASPFTATPRSLARLSRPALERLEVFPRIKWPLISVVMPTYNTPLNHLDSAISSVKAQGYPLWELCVADDGSSDENVRRNLRSHAECDPRIKIALNPNNAGISQATNAAIFLASGSFTAFLDHDDELTPDALAEIALAILEKPAADALYSDQDKIDENGSRFEPFYKPAWSPVYLLGVMYVGHFLVVRTELLRKLCGCDSRYDKVQDFELMLRIGEITSEIVHIPKILYHWRALPGSIATSANAKGGIESLQAAAVQAYLDRHNFPLRATPHTSLPHRIQLYPKMMTDKHLVSIIIPTKDAAEHIHRCLETIFSLTQGCRYEVIVADTGTTEPEALAAQDAFPIKRIEYLGPFNFSKVNNRAAEEARGEFLLFLNNDTEVIDPHWLCTLLAHHSLPNIGAVGPLLVYPHGLVQHAGVVIGFRGTADHVLRNAESASDGYAGSLPCAHEVSAVTAACLMMPRDLFMELGGFEEAYSCHYQDTDLCLRIRETGRSVLHVGNTTLRHHESVSRGGTYDLVDRAIFQDRWAHILDEGDPFYNPNFNLHRTDYSVC
jgi:O-antigen biosynthesis protein